MSAIRHLKLRMSWRRGTALDHWHFSSSSIAVQQQRMLDTRTAEWWMWQAVLRPRLEQLPWGIRRRIRELLDRQRTPSSDHSTSSPRFMIYRLLWHELHIVSATSKVKNYTLCNYFRSEVWNSVWAVRPGFVTGCVSMICFSLYFELCGNEIKKEIKK